MLPLNFTEPKGYNRIGALLMFAGVALGAFGAHALDLSGRYKDIYQTASFYLIVHGLALLIYSLKAIPSLAGPLIFVGTLIFSGSLYLLVLTQTGWLGAITPMGGTLLLMGWLVWALKAR